ncbi:MAG TPA: Ig-like domain-containing protein [Nitrososphaeraceae archaeon]|nr:Ig-like domain-containing protein [Nitrososphaeraceae archaeon]
MYEKYLVLVLLFFIGGNIIGISFQFYNDHHILAQSNQESETDDQESETDDQESEANQEPKADDQEVSVDANDNVKITLDGKDDDKDDEIEFDIVSDPSHGQLDNFDKSDGKVTYAPDKDYSGDDEFKFKVTDNNGAESNTAEVRININSINQPIQGTGNEAAQGTGNEAAQQGVSNETNQEGVSNETNQGTANETNQGTANETNQEVIDNQTTSTNVQTNITEAANIAPTAYDQSLSTNVNDTIDITLVGDDADNDTIQFAIVSNPSDASLDNFDLTKGTVTYIPQTDYVGNDTFGFNVIDDKGAESNTATVSVNVTGNNQTNQPPQVFDQSTDESNLTDYRYAVWSTGEEEDRYILFSRSNDGGNSFSSPLSLSGKSRSAVFNPEVSSSGNNVYVVWQGQSKNGNQDILLRKSSDYGSTFSETENLSNDPGGSGNPDVTIDGNSTHIAWEGTTPGNNFIFYTKSDEGSDFDSPQKLSSNTGISYKPEIIVKDESVTDSFTYKAKDSKGAESNVATVNVNMDPNDESTLKDDTKIVSEDTSHEFDITLQANDPDKDPVEFEIVTPPSEGRLENFDPNSGTVTYVPNENGEIDIHWHNYINGNDRVMTKIIDAGEGDNAAAVQNNDPFKTRQ